MLHSWPAMSALFSWVWNVPYDIYNWIYSKYQHIIVLSLHKDVQTFIYLFIYLNLLLQCPPHLQTHKYPLSANNYQVDISILTRIIHSLAFWSLSESSNNSGNFSNHTRFFYFNNEKSILLQKPLSTQSGLMFNC